MNVMFRLCVFTLLKPVNDDALKDSSLWIRLSDCLRGPDRSVLLSEDKLKVVYIIELLVIS